MEIMDNNFWARKEFVSYVKTEREEIWIKNVEMEAKSEIWNRISRMLKKLNLPAVWSDNPILCFILASIDQEDIIQTFLDACITDLWLPIQKPVLKRFSSEDDAKSFLKQQEQCMEEVIPRPFTGEHFCVVDFDHLDMEEVKKLGEGGHGRVWSVKDHQSQELYARKTITRPTKFKWHVDAMKNFKREVYGMRRVNHRHCVKLLASLTDMDSMVLLSSPVADMDLTSFLNSDLTPSQTTDLRRMLGCITSAIAYLHDLKIRHDDLKPNNILIHGSNVLLTDFGVCLDASDSGVTTTTGPPEHSVRRYSAPEVFDHSSRNRLTDIWGLGCILFEIVSRLQGHKLKEMRSFWKSTGNCSESYANNPVATAAWLDCITKGSDKSQFGTERRHHLMASFIYHALLERDRLLRPTATQVLDKLIQMDIIHPGEHEDCWVSECCYQEFYHMPQQEQLDQFLSTGPSLAPVPFLGRVMPQWPIPDLRLLDKHLAYVFLSLSLETLAWSDNLDSFRDKTKPSSIVTLNNLFSSGSVKKLKDLIPTMLEGLGLSNRKAAYPSSQGLTHHDLLQNLYVSSLLKTLSVIGCFDTSSFVPSSDDLRSVILARKCHIVQISLTTVCLQRHALAGAPYLVLIFDPTALQYGSGQNQSRLDTWTSGLKSDTDWRRRVKDRQRRFDCCLDKRLNPKKCQACKGSDVKCDVFDDNSTCTACAANNQTCQLPSSEFLVSQITERAFHVH